MTIMSVQYVRGRQKGAVMNNFVPHLIRGLDQCRRLLPSTSNTDFECDYVRMQIRPSHEDVAASGHQENAEHTSGPWTF